MLPPTVHVPHPIKNENKEQLPGNENIGDYKVISRNAGKCMWQWKVPVAVENASVAISNLLRDDYLLTTTFAINYCLETDLGYVASTS
jgi:hypothetical protein